LRTTIATLVSLFTTMMASACGTAQAAEGQRPMLVLQIPGPRAHVPVRRRTRPVLRRPTVVVTPAPPAALPADADDLCLERIDGWRIPYRAVGAVRGVKTPIEITGPIRGVGLIPRAGWPPVMDCELARALAEAAPIFHQHGITALSYSGTYSYRNVRGTSHLSGHAHGLAIDVHGLQTTAGPIEVERDYPKDGNRWGVPRDNVAACLGQPLGAAATTVRALACELRAHPAFHLIMSPDDNYDHRNHLHIEAYPSRSTDLLSSTGDKPAVVHRGRGGRRHR
jgi:hypothetical protein